MKSNLLKHSAITTLVVCLLLSACSIEKRCHKLEKRIVRDAKYCNVVTKDTITVHDTVKIDGVAFDTIVDFQTDTIRIDTGRLHVRIVRLPGDKIFVRGECDTVFVPIEIQVPVEKVVVKEVNVIWRTLIRGLRRWFWILIVIAVAYIIYKFRKKIPFPI